MSTFPGVAASVPAARRFVMQAMTDLGAGRACDDAVSLVSELATNAVLHAHSEFTINVTRLGETVRIRVYDLSPVLPRPRTYGADSTTGRGLRLIATIASDWGVDRQGPGKSIWFDLPAHTEREIAPWDEKTTEVDAILASFDDDRSTGVPPAARAMAA
jgi:anti-sigma regulatory factor (Ser/Thr protein kinase)